MSRKLFISFLGTGNYSSTIYAPTLEHARKANPTRFIQEAVIRYHCQEFTTEDQIIIFTTKGALKNWKDGEHEDYHTKEKEFKLGLETRLNELNLPSPHPNIMIPDGKSTKEIWEIFDIVVEQIREEDEIFFDVTHGFRTLPLLNMALINYSKVLKKVKVGGIYYGAFDGPEKDGDFSYSPIWDLKSFADLQDWTNAANLFIKSGSAVLLEELAIEKLIPVIKEKNEYANTAKTVNKIISKIASFSNALAANRGNEIVKARIFEELHDLVDRELPSDQISAPLIPLFQKIDHQLASFSLTEDINNGFSAVQWAIDHNLTQQGYTLLQETIISYFCGKFGVKQDLEKEREIISNGFFGKRSPQHANEITPYISDNLSKIYEAITSNRNDINHAGFTRQKTAENLKKDLVSLFIQVKEEIAIFEESHNQKG